MIYLDSNEAIRFISQFCDTSHLSFLVVQHIQRMSQLLLGFSLKYTPRSMNQVADFFWQKELFHLALVIWSSMVRLSFCMGYCKMMFQAICLGFSFSLFVLCFGL